MKFFSDAGQFLERVQPFLLKREAEHCLILGLLDELRSGEELGAEPPLMASVEERGEVAGVALMTPPRNLVLSWTAGDSTLDTIARELHAAGVVIPGVNGSADIAQKFVSRWSELSGCSYRVQMAQRIYQLRLVTNESRAAGRLREPTLSDEALLREWRAAFSMDGSAVSMAGYSGRTPNGIRVAWVYTPPENRGKGFAGACVAALSQKLLDDGRRFCFLYTDLANPISNHIYQKMGYEPVIDATVYSLSQKVR